MTYKPVPVERNAYERCLEYINGVATSWDAAFFALLDMSDDVARARLALSYPEHVHAHYLYTTMGDGPLIEMADDEHPLVVRLKLKEKRDATK